MARLQLDLPEAKAILTVAVICICLAALIVASVRIPNNDPSQVAARVAVTDLITQHDPALATCQIVGTRVADPRVDPTTGHASTARVLVTFAEPCYRPTAMTVGAVTAKAGTAVFGFVYVYLDAQQHATYMAAELEI